MKKVMILVASLMVSVISFAGYTSDMVNRMETKEKSVEDSFGGSNVEMKEAADRFCETVNGEKLFGTGYGLEYTGSLINSTRDRAIELSKRYEKLK